MQPMGGMAARVFSEDDQLAFAVLSGDVNPLHMDPVAARRTQAGAPVVHGVHGLLWALDELSAHFPLETLSTLKVRFERFIPVTQPVELRVVKATETSLRADITLDGIPVTLITLALGPRSVKTPPPHPNPGVRVGAGPEPVRVLSLDQIAETNGHIDHVADATRIAQTFPRLSAKIGPSRIAALASSSRLVGMVCPGLHSIFLKIAVDLVDAPQDHSGIDFTVTRVDQRFRLTTMNIAGDGLLGSVECLVRMPPVAQPAYKELLGWVEPDAFAATTALIVGGSRGLGELTAKLIAAGGGQCLITYAVGQADAQAVAQEINAGGGRCDILPYDVKRDAARQLQALPTRLTHLYYFATPQIFRQKSNLYSPDLARDYLSVYADSFYELCRMLADKEHPLTAFYPSSVAVEERPRDMTEYAMAKSAG